MEPDAPSRRPPGHHLTLGLGPGDPGSRCLGQGAFLGSRTFPAKSSPVPGRWGGRSPCWGPEVLSVLETAPPDPLDTQQAQPNIQIVERIVWTLGFSTTSSSTMEGRGHNQMPCEPCSLPRELSQTWRRSSERPGWGPRGPVAPRGPMAPPANLIRNCLWRRLRHLW